MITTMEKQTMMMHTTLKTNLPEAGWRCVLEEDMAQCVMTPGTIRMPLWSADNWDSPHMVCNVYVLLK